MKACKCKRWKYVKQLDDLITFAWTHGMSWDGKPFCYCPYCGEKLQEANDKKCVGSPKQSRGGGL